MDPEIQKLMMAEALRREQQRRADEAQKKKKASEKKAEKGTGLAREVGKGM